MLCAHVLCAHVLCSCVEFSCVECSCVVCSCVECSCVVCSCVVCSCVVCSCVECSCVECSCVVFVVVEVSEDCRSVSLVGQTVLAGSCCTLLNTFSSLVHVLDVPIGQAVSMLSENPARSVMPGLQVKMPSKRRSTSLQRPICIA